MPFMLVFSQFSFWACLLQTVFLSQPVCCGRFDRCALKGIHSHAPARRARAAARARDPDRPLRRSGWAAVCFRCCSIVLTIIWIATREPTTTVGLAPYCWHDGIEGKGTSDDYYDCYRRPFYCGQTCVDLAANATTAVWWSRKGFVTPAGRYEDEELRANAKKPRAPRRRRRAGGTGSGAGAGTRAF